MATEFWRDTATFIKFSEANRNLCEDPSGFGHSIYSWTLSDWMTATMGELGEAANIAKKLNRVRDSIRCHQELTTILKEDLRDEIADTFIYLDLMAQSQGFLLVDSVINKFGRTSRKIGWKG